MNFYKRAQGLYIDNTFKDSTGRGGPVFRTQISGAVSRGKFARQVFFGVENNQGPYRLKGADNEPFIIVLSGTEKIYIDGKLLQRGQENDYIIDYNTGELTFTARQMITKDKRIVAEFQYAERNYARSLFLMGEEKQRNRSKVYLNIYSEQDNKNKTMHPSRTQDQKNVMIGIGDTLGRAYYTGVEEATFNTSDVFYMKRDTMVNDIIYSPVYVYSQDAEVAKYRLKFSNVGAGRGNYNQVSSGANGRVYAWVAPQNGLPSGSFEPVIPLVTPKLQQMLTAGVSHSLTALNVLDVEGVYTRKDINRFSAADKGNDEAAGMRVVSRNEVLLGNDSLRGATRLKYDLNYEYIQKQFSQVERFRSIEFERDWNRPLNSAIINDQHLAGASVGLVGAGKSGMTYGVNVFNEGTTYRGLRQNVMSHYNGRLLSTSYSGSYLETDDRLNVQNTKFYRHKVLLSRRVRKIKLAYTDDFENNRFINPLTGSLLPRAYQFWEWEGSVANADTSKNHMRVFYKERRDRLAYGQTMKDSTFATNIGFQASVYSIRNNPFSVLMTYRKLELRNVVGMFLKPDNTLLNRIEYNPRYFKGFITAGLFYETGYGLENKKEFYYLEVAPGQGQYAWNDYNGNGIRELNEFENSQFSDQARYIRIYTPTSQYVKVLQNQMSVSFNIRPASLPGNSSGPLRMFVNRWALQSVVRHDNKISDDGSMSGFNPLLQVADSLLLSTNNNLRQSVFFNQSSAVFGADYTYVDNQSRQLLTNGIEKRTLRSHEVRWRFNFLRAWSIASSNIASQKGNSSQFFFSRNYFIRAYESEQKLIYQPSTVLRVTGIFKYNEKLNAIEGGFQKAVLHTFATEFKYNQTEKGSFTGRVDYIRISYNDSENSSIAYEMLNGLSKGNNYTWEIGYQRNLNSNIQISINYNARKTPGAPPVHLGGAQVRAFF
jgi:hypothetical protein